MRGILIALTLVLATLPRPSAAAEPLRLYAAGSLRAALSDIARAFEIHESVRVEAKFGASGLLRDEIGKGTQVEVFASANIEHPLSLARDGKAGPIILFTCNRICALARPSFDVSRQSRRPYAGPGGEVGDVHPQGRSVRRLCLGGLPQDREDAPG